MHFRLATSADLPALSELYASVVRKLGPELYTEDQIRVWSASAENPERFRDFVLKPHTMVAVVDDSDAPVGFAGLEPTGRIASLYVHEDYGRQGIASALLKELLKKAADDGLTQLRCEASKFSRPVFERFGFRLDEVERGTHYGVPFMRYLMSKREESSAIRA